MPVGFKEMLAEAEAEVTSITADEAESGMTNGSIVMIDVRDPRELERDGMIPRAFHAPRGMLEFWIDPESPYHKPIFAEEKTYVFYCAAAWRSLLAAQLAKHMGLDSRSLIGGLSEWKKQGKPIAFISN